MVPLSALWLPILLSAVFVFVASSVLHMALQVHKKDFAKLPDEEQLLAALRAHGVKPGQYMFPCAGSMKEMGTPEMQAKFARGPVGNIVVVRGVSIARSLAQWFVLSLVVSACAAYVAGLAFAPGTDGMLVFRVTSTAALLGYALTHAQDSIWKGLAWSTTARFVFDGFVYACVTGATFAWLWPHAGPAL